MRSRAGRVLLAFLRSATTLRERSSPRVIPICYGHVRLNVSGLFPVSPRETLHFGADFPGLDNNDCIGDARRLRGILHHSNFARLTSGLGSCVTNAPSEYRRCSTVRTMKEGPSGSAIMS